MAKLPPFLKIELERNIKQMDKKKKKNMIDLSKFNELQLEQILLGKKSKINISIYADPIYDSFQMACIREGLEKKLDVSKYLNPEFDSFQMGQILDGLKARLNVSIYADTKYTGQQMREIRLGLQRGLDVSWYLNEQFNELQMEQIRVGLIKKLDVKWYAHEKFNYSQMYEIYRGLMDKLDVSLYADNNLSYIEMQNIRVELTPNNAQEIKDKINSGELLYGTYALSKKALKDLLAKIVDNELLLKLEDLISFTHDLKKYGNKEIPTTDQLQALNEAVLFFQPVNDMMNLLNNYSGYLNANYNSIEELLIETFLQDYDLNIKFEPFTFENSNDQYVGVPYYNLANREGGIEIQTPYGLLNHQLEKRGFDKFEKQILSNVEIKKWNEEYQFLLNKTLFDKNIDIESTIENDSFLKEFSIQPTVYESLGLL